MDAAAPPTLVQKLAAEAIGTMVLVVIGVGAAIFSEDLAATGLAFGIAIVAMVYSFGRISGGHFNPAVSVGAALGGRIPWKDAGAYAGAQVVGGLVGGIVLLVISLTGDTGYEFGENGLGANGFGDQGNIELFGALILEVVLTFIFVTVILSTTDERNEHPALAPLAIGLTLAAVHFVGIGLDGTSVNPARSLSVAFFSGGDVIVQQWLFIIGPLLGAALAGLAYPALFGHASAPVPGSGLNFAGKPSGQGGQGGQGGYGGDQFQQQWNQPAGGYQQPGAYGGGTAAPASQSTPQSAQQSAHQAEQQAEQPIIQDGWQWDPQAQQWIPAQQQAPQAPQQGGWPSPGGGEQTQVRPNDGQ